MADSGLADFKLTIGELFPADDLVAQWVFTLTSVAEDLMLLTKELREVEADDLRDYVLFYRLLLTRILEARELVRAWKKYSAIRDFTRGELKWGKLDLVAVYTRPAADQRSVVEQLYVDSRNRTSHYSKIGESELAGLLRDYQRFPARIANYEKNDRLQAEYVGDGDQIPRLDRQRTVGPRRPAEARAVWPGDRRARPSVDHAEHHAPDDLREAAGNPDGPGQRRSR